MNRHDPIEPAPADAGASTRTSAGASARQRAYDGIRAGILRGEFRPGTFIEEIVATETTGVSRSPVREALNRLAAEGFLELHPRRGALVKPLGSSEVGDLHEVRLMIETRAIERFCDLERRVPDELRSLCAAYDGGAREDDLEHVRLNWLFHRGLVAASGNGVLVQVFDNLEANVTRVAMLSLRLGVGDTATIAREHSELIDALAAHDRPRALDLIERHLRPVRALDGDRQTAPTGRPVR